MLGYTYKDIQEFGISLTSAIELYSELKLDSDVQAGLLKVWDFFEGLLAEGYVAE
jgi:hypothetical protein